MRCSLLKKIDYEKEVIIIIADDGSEAAINKSSAFVDDENNIVNIPFQMFQWLFYVSYAIAIYKSQGSTFDFGYTIHEYDHPMFDNRLKYVALSRSTSIQNINIIN